MKTKKAQGAMEYLMTYSWAILVVMVVGIAMWQLGVFNIGGGMTPTSMGFGALKPQLAGTGIKADNAANPQFDAIITNGAGTTVKVTGLSVSTTNGDCSGERVNGAVASVAIPVPISGGDNFKITAITCGQGAIGSPYVVTIGINYTIAIGTVESNRTSAGTIRGPYE